MASSTSVANGCYRIRQAGAKSDIANMISDGKKCHYVQIGSEKTPFGSLEEAIEFVQDKGLEADRMSLDYGMKKAPPAEESPEEDVAAESDESTEG